MSGPAARETMIRILTGGARAAGVRHRSATSIVRFDRAFLAAVLVTLLAGWAGFAVAAISPTEVRWVGVETSTTADLHAVSFASATDGLAVGAAGTILGTHDGGAGWTAVASESTAALYAVDVDPAGAAWAVGEGGVIRTSVDGTSWNTVASGVATDLLGVSFADASTGWAVGRGSTVLATTDGGSTWTTQSAGVSATATITGVTFLDATRGWAWGDEGTVLRTIDGGSTWTTSTVATDAGTLRAGSFVDAQTGWVGGDDGLVMKTTDGGLTWVEQPLGTGEPVRGIAFVDAENGYVIGGEETATAGFVVKTSDGGVTWAAQATDATGTPRAVCFTDPEHGWIVGAGGLVLRAVPDTAPPIEPGPSAAPAGIVARAMASGEVLVGWSGTIETAPPTSYRIRRSVAGGDFASLAIVSASTAPGFTDKTAPPLADVAYTVSTIDASGEGTPSAPVSVTTAAPRAPDDPRPATMTCTGCHSAHERRTAPAYTASPDGDCFACHARDIGERLTGADASTRHDLLTADQASHGSRLTCANCHQPHVSSESTPVVDPDDPGPAGGMAGVTDAFCLRCHDSSLPTSAETTRWAAAPLAVGGGSETSDIASSWVGSVHGAGASVAPDLRGGMGYAVGDPLECATCHDPHGSTNRSTLREVVPSREGTGQAEALLVVPLSGGGADMRLFCGGCHTLTSHPEADLSQWPLDCTPCHSHGTAGL